VAPIADDLDRMLQRLVRALRERGAAEALRPCEVLDLAQDIIPYRLLRREGGFDTNEDYEHALTRLLSGERGYVRGDARMQQVLREELASRNPDTALFREFARNHVALTEDGLAAADGFDVGSTAQAVVATVPAPLPSDPPPRRVSAVTAAFADVDPTSDTEADMAVAPIRSVTAQALGGKCRYCAASLPDGRKIVFCPFCGHDLTMTQCPACSTELELGWKFCVTCGRSMAGRTTSSVNAADTKAPSGP
jgi:hypothetical protein